MTHAEMPPKGKRTAIRYRCRGPLEREIQFNYDGERIFCTGRNGIVGADDSIEELRCLADNLGVASRALLAPLSESQAREARAREEGKEKLLLNLARHANIYWGDAVAKQLMEWFEEAKASRSGEGE